MFGFKWFSGGSSETSLGGWGGCSKFIRALGIDLLVATRQRAVFALKIFDYSLLERALLFLKPVLFEAIKELLLAVFSSSAER